MDIKRLKKWNLLKIEVGLGHCHHFRKFFSVPMIQVHFSHDLAHDHDVDLPGPRRGHHPTNVACGEQLGCGSEGAAGEHENQVNFWAEDVALRQVISHMACWKMDH